MKTSLIAAAALALPVYVFGQSPDELAQLAGSYLGAVAMSEELDRNQCKAFPPPRIRSLARSKQWIYTLVPAQRLTEFRTDIDAYEPEIRRTAARFIVEAWANVAGKVPKRETACAYLHGMVIGLGSHAEEKLLRYEIQTFGRQTRPGNR